MGQLLGPHIVLELDKLVSVLQKGAFGFDLR
jgi:hypothetical protein